MSATTTITTPLLKGLTISHLEGAFGVREIGAGYAVPFFDIDGTLLFEKTIPTTGSRFLMPAGQRVVPYGLETLRFGGNTVFLTEGESDCWELRSAYPTTPVLGIPGASSWRPEWTSYVADREVVYLAFDGDDAGERLLDTVWPDIPWARRVKLPPGMDSRDVFQIGGGLEAFERLLREADFIAGATRLIVERAAG